MVIYQNIIKVFEQIDLQWKNYGTVEKTTLLWKKLKY